MQENHDEQQKEYLLQAGDEDAVLRPPAHVHQVDDGLRRVYGVDQHVDDGVDEGNAQRQKAVADQAAEEVIALARAEVHQLCEIVNCLLLNICKIILKLHSSS